MTQRWDTEVCSGLTRCGSPKASPPVSFGVPRLLASEFTSLAKPAIRIALAGASEEQDARQNGVTLAALLVRRVPEELRVQRAVLGGCRQHQVLRPVVRSVLVEVMHDLLSCQGSAEDLAHDQSVFKDSGAINRQHPVAVREAPVSLRPWTMSKRIACSLPALPVVFAPASRDCWTGAVGYAAGVAG